MYTKKITIIGLILTTMLMLSCNPQKQVAGHYSYETECLGTELDGSQTLKAWGTGRNLEDAVEQAKKQALKDVIFKGINKGKPDCNMKPLVIEVQAQEKYEDYWFKFFADGGLYSKFTSHQDGKYLKKLKAGDQMTYGVTVRVLRQELKKQLLEDKILK